ncbi:putative transposase [Orientia tsutsugamushi str. Sido]|nr:putative transposase [Orientia tsutsugamushi str. Sido]
MVDKKTRQVICTDFSNGKKHDFRLFKKSKILIHPKVKAITDTGYQGIQKIHNNFELYLNQFRKRSIERLQELITECIGIYMLIRNDANLRLVIYPK